MFDKILKLREWLANNQQHEAARDLVGIVKLAAKKDRLKEIYPGFESDIDLLSSSIHTKYLAWAAEEIVDGNISAEDIIPIIQRFDHISKNLDKEIRDINVYSSIIRLKKIVEEFGMTESEKRKAEKKKIGQDTDFIYKSKKFLVISPLSQEASCYWGRNTQWCISGDAGNMFETYSSKNLFFYFIIDKEASNDDPMQRIALTFKDKKVHEEEIRNATDESLTLGEVKGHLGDEWGAIYANIVEDQGGKDYTREGQEFALLEQKLISGEDTQNVINDIGHFFSGDDFTGTADRMLEIINNRIDSGEDPGIISAIINSNIEFKRLFAGRFGNPVGILLGGPAFSRENLTEIIVKINTDWTARFLDPMGPGTGAGSVLEIIKYIKDNQIQLDTELSFKLYNVMSNRIHFDGDLEEAATYSSNNFIKFVLEETRGGLADDIERVFKEEGEKRGLIVKERDDFYDDDYGW